MNVHYDFTGEVLVVSGGASGIGAGIAKAYADAGGTVVCLDINEDLLVQAKSSYEGPGVMQVMRLDVGEPQEVQETISSIVREHGKIDSLILSAAIQPRTEISEMPDNEWKRVMNVNLNGAFYCTRAVVPVMKEKGRGSIVTFSSGLASQGYPTASAYATTKAGLIAYTKSLARELLPYHVRANIIAPGITNSPLFTGPNNIEDQEYFRKRVGAVGTVEDVVKLLLFLVSDASLSLTGSLLNRELVFPS